MEITKKRLLFFILVVLVILLSLVYRSYVENRTLESLKNTERSLKIFNWAEETDKVEIDRIIKRSPREIIMIVKWKEDKAYVSIENWLTKSGDKIILNLFDKKKSLTGYE